MPRGDKEGWVMASNSYVLLVGVQFDETGEATWREALRLAGRREGVTIHLAHVVADEKLPGATRSSPSARKKALDQAAEDLQVFALDKAGPMHPPYAVKVRLHVCIGDVARRLADYAIELRSDAVVIGAHTREGWPGIEHGWVASELLRIIPCSLLVVRPPAWPSAQRAVSVERDPFPSRPPPPIEDDDRISFPLGFPELQRR